MQNNPHIQEQDLRELHQDAVQWAMYCVGYEADLGREVVQQAYLKVVEGSARFEGRSTLKTWLFGVIRLTALECRRKHRLHAVAAADYMEPDMLVAPADTREEFSEQYSAAAVAQALAALSRMQREIMYLAFYRELTLSEIADILGVSIGTIRTQYHRAKQKMSRLLLAGESDGKTAEAIHQ